MTMLLVRPVLATVGAVIHMSKKRVSFSYVDKKVFYETASNKIDMQHPSCISLNNTIQVKTRRKMKQGKIKWSKEEPISL